MYVMVAANESDHGVAAVQNGITEADLRQLPLALLVLDAVSETPPRLAVALADHKGSPDVRFREESRTHADAILDLIDELNPAVVVMGSDKRNSKGDIRIGTTTQRILLDSPTQVLIVKTEYDA